jgi:hypothetical protein
MDRLARNLDDLRRLVKNLTERAGHRSRPPPRAEDTRGTHWIHITHVEKQAKKG